MGNDADITVRVTAHSGTIQISHPGRSNALNRQMMTDLAQAFTDLHQEKKVRAIILVGSGSHFCSGLDLQEMHRTAQSEPQEAMPQWHQDWVQLKDLLETMLRFPKPIIAAVDGAALGAGFGITLAADMVIASNSARIGIPSARRGVLSGIVAPLLNFRCGARTTARMMLAGEELTPQEALRLNLVNELVDASQIWARAHEIAEQCAKSPSEALQLSKRLLNETIGEELLTQMSVGAAMGATSCTTEAAIEGISAFVEGRDPEWP